MQTFLPYDDFEQTARCLDWRRLGKQRVETWQILQTLIGNSQSWKNHPAVKMWQGYEFALVEYGLITCTEWISRGYRDTMRVRFRAIRSLNFDLPQWLGDKEFHLSHRSNLVRKLPNHYGLIWPDVPNNLPYVWPQSK